MRYDTIIIGGSFAGLSAALYLERARRAVCILDSNKPRNRFSKATHGLFAQDGSNLAAMLATIATSPAGGIPLLLPAPTASWRHWRSIAR